MKRILALILSIVMAVSSLPLPALAAETAEDAASVEAHALPAEVPNEEIRESTALPTDVTEAPAPEEAEGTSETAESPEGAAEAAPVAEEPAAKAQPEVIASGTCGMGLAWSLSSPVGYGDKYVLTITGTGAIPDFEYDDSFSWYDSPWRDYTDSIRKVEIAHGVTRIGNYAFYKFTALTDLSIPSSVESIGECSIYKCTALKELTIPEGVRSIERAAFCGCSGLGVTAPLTLPGTLTTLGNSAFAECTGLKSLAIPASVTEIGERLTRGSTALEQILVETGSRSFVGLDGVLLSRDLTILYDYPAQKKDTSYQVPQGVKRICDYAFAYHPYLQEIQLPDGLEEIGKVTFYETKLRNVTFPDGIRELGEASFMHCASLRTITFLGGPPYIDGNAFHYVTADVYYPGWDPEWNDSNKKQYFGKLTWIPLEKCPHENRTQLDAVEPTCTRTGQTAGEVCADCGEIFSGRKEIPALGHVMGNAQLLQEPTCTLEGRRAALCSRCGENVEETVPALGHKETVIAGQAATCTKPGLTEGKYCSVCGWVLSAREEVPALGHEEGTPEIILPTCGAAGYTGSKCSRCGESRKYDYTPATGEHSYSGAEDTVCDVCGFTQVPCIASGTCGKGVNWILDEENTLTISGVGTMTNYSDYAPAPWAGYANDIRKLVIEPGVASIGAWAFWDLFRVSEVTVPESVTDIGMYAFNDCISLRSITVPASVTHIGIAAFRECENLSITFLGTTAQWVSLCEADPVKTHCSDGIVCTWGFCGDNLRFTLIDGRLALSGFGRMWDYSNANYYSWHPYRSQITEIILPEGLADIGPWAFCGCEQVKELTIPSGVVRIGKGAFSDLRGMTTLTLPEEISTIPLSAFANCSSLTEVTVPEGVTAIGDSAFYGCSALTRLQLPESLTSMGTQAFKDCQSLTALTIPGNCSRIEYQTFYNCSSLATLTLSKGVTAIEEEAFYGCNALTQLQLPEGLVSIGDSAFYGCSALTQLQLPEGLTSVGKSAFIKCYSLKTLTIPEGVTALGDSAFNGCNALTQLQLPESLAAIGYNAFFGCSSLKTLTIPKGVTELGGSAFSGCSSLTRLEILSPVGVLESGTFRGCSNLTELILGEGVTAIGRNLFSDCGALTSVTLPETLQEIGGSAFSYCSSLKEVTIPGGVRVISNNAFHSCYALETVVISEGVEEIGAAAFNDCKSLRSLTLPEGLTSIGEWAFGYCGQLTGLAIPKGVTDIGANAFYKCKAMASLTLPETLTTIGENAFYECNSLTSLTVPGSLTTMGLHIFSGCSALTELVLSEGLTTVGKSMFSRCYSLTSLTLPGSLTTIEESAFWDCNALTELVIPEGVTTIGHSAFDFCESLCSLTLPESLTYIGGYAFRRCDSLTSVTIPKNVTYYGEHAFDANSVKQIRFEGSAPEFHSNAFQFQTITVYYPGDDPSWTADKLQNYGGKVTWLPHCGSSHVSVTDPGVDATCLDAGLTEGSHCGECGVVLSAQTVIPALGHEKVVLEAVEPDCFTAGLTEGEGCSRCGEVLTPQEVVPALGHSMEGGTCIRCGRTGLVEKGFCGETAEYEFYEDGTLLILGSGTVEGKTILEGKRKQVLCLEFQEGITTIGAEAFRDMENLKNVLLPASLEAISDGAFRDCGLEEVTLPAALRSLGKKAFDGCKQLKQVTFLGAATSELAALPKNGGVARYHGEDPSWTAEVRKRIGSGWTWEDLGMEVVQEGFCGENARWQLTANGTLTVTGSGTVEDGFWEIRDQVRRVIIAPGVREIAGFAFYDMPMTSLSVADTVKNLGEYAFTDCDNLVTAELTGAEVLGQGAFYGCDSLRNVTFGEQLRVISWDSFSECHSLDSITLPGSLVEIGGYAFHNCPLKEIVIPASVRIIGCDAFSGTALEKVTFRGDAPEIESNAFLDVTAQAYCKFTWTQEQMDSCGGELTWLPLDYVEVSGEKQVTGGKTVKLTARIVSEKGLGGKITWSLRPEDKAFAKLSASGNTATVTALDVTEVRQITVIAKTQGDITPCEYTLTILPQVKGLDIYQVWSDDYGEGQWTKLTDGDWWYYLLEDWNRNGFEQQITAVFLPEGSQAKVTWSSSNTKVATVDRNGLVRFTGQPGSTVITAKTDKGIKASYTQKVIDPIRNVEAVGGNQIHLRGGESVTMKVRDTDTGKIINNKDIYWYVHLPQGGDPSAYAVISASGKLTTKKVLEPVEIQVVGEVMTDGVHTAYEFYNIYLHPAATHVEITRYGEPVNGQTLYFALARDDELTLDARLLPEGTMEGALSWTISDKKEAYASYFLSEDGRSLRIAYPTGKTGTVTLTAKALDGSGKSASVKVQFLKTADFVSIPCNTLELVSGRSVKLEAEVYPADVTKPGVTWSLVNPADKAYVTLSGNKLTAKTVFEDRYVTLVATSKDGMASEYLYTVITPKDPGMLVIANADTGEGVTRSTVYVDLNMQHPIRLQAYNYSDGSLAEVSWTVKNGGMAQVYQDGDVLVVDMLKAGSITVTAKDGKRTATVTVKAARLASGIEITTKNGKNIVEEYGTRWIEVASGKSVDLKALVFDAASSKVTWSIVEGGQYAKISTSGKVTATKNLTATREVRVRATAADGSGVYGEITVLVKPLATGIHIYSLEGDMNRQTLSAYSYGWKNNRSNTDNTWDMNENSGYRMYADVYPYYEYDSYNSAIQGVTWKSSNPKVASIDENGQVIFHKPGTATLTATAMDGSGAKVSCKITLVKRVTGMELPDARVEGGKKLKLKPIILPKDTTTKQFYWEIIGGDTAFAKIDQKGNLTTKKVTAPKTVTVRVWAQDFTDIYADCQVTIYPKNN